MKLTEQIQRKKTSELSKICHLAKNLYNSANWLIRMRYFFRLKADRFNDKWFRKQKIEILKKHRKEFHFLLEYFNDLKKLRENYISKLNFSKGKQGYYDNIKFLYYEDVWNLLKFEQVYKDLPAQTSQQILKLLGKNWKSYFGLMREYRKNFKKLKGKRKFLPKPKIPKYKKKNGESITIFTNQQCKIRDGYLIFPKKKCNINSIKTRIVGKINQVSIIPKGIVYTVEIIYEKEIEDLKLNKKNILSIDLGLNRIITAVNNNGFKPFIIKGNDAKSINQYYNKQLAYYKSIAKKMNNIPNKEIGSTKKINKLHLKRNNMINDIFHKISKYVEKYCIKNNIGSVAIGYNIGWKYKINLGKKTNQNFVSIPFLKLINQIKYKCELKGIQVLTTNESYTSKCSFFDNEEIKKHKIYKGKRINRDWFRTSTGKLIDADVNAAYNIMKKLFPKAFCNGMEVLGLEPEIVNI